LSPEKPVVYILHGDDKMAIEQYIAALEARMGDPSLAEMNISRLDGRLASDEDLRTATMALPFLADRRLVILTNPLARLSGKESTALQQARERFIKLLDGLPESTALVLVIDDLLRYKGWDTLKADHWLSVWAGKAGKRALVHPCSLPDPQAMPGWIANHAQKAGGKFTPQAAAALAEHTGSDTALALQEITKLLTYVDHQRTVEADDVALLVETGGPVDVYKMVGALAERNAKKASSLLHELLDERSAQDIFFLIVRQFRYILQMREILDEGGNFDTVKRELPNIKFAYQYFQQAQRFTRPELDAIYHRLLQLDEGIKSSQMTGELALDLLVAEIAH
jgi:DNA polymerase-3 subunit delta